MFLTELLSLTTGITAITSILEDYKIPLRSKVYRTILCGIQLLNLNQVLIRRYLEHSHFVILYMLQY